MQRLQRRKPFFMTAFGVLSCLFCSSMANSQEPPPSISDSKQPISRQKDGATHPALVNARKADKDDPYWQRANKEEYLSVKELHVAHKKFKTPKAKVMARGDQKRRVVTLTFDDGPHPDFTPRLLKVLSDYNIKATFFVVGEMVEKHPDMAKLIVEQGHEIANHTFSHVNLSKVTPDLVRVEYRACNDIVEKITGKRPRYARPPGGQLNQDVLIAATEEGMTTVLWNDDPGDYANPGIEILLTNIHKTLSDGAIILLHDGSEEMIQLLPGLLEELKKKNWTIAPLDKASRPTR